MSKYFDNKDSFMGPKTTQYGSHMVMTNVVKETRKKYVNIDTRFHDEYMSGNTYNVTLPERINDVKSMLVCNAEIPMSIYNVSADLGNNCFKITSNGTSSIITIPDGNYDATSLVTAISTALTVTTLSCSVVNNKFTFTLTNGSADTTIDFAIDSTGAYDKYNFKGKFGWMVGYRELSIELSYSADDSVSGTAFVNLQSPRYLYLVVDEFTRGNQNSFMSPLAASFINKNILARIVLDSFIYPYGTILTANLSNGYLLSDCRSYTGKVDLQRLSVQLVNEYGVPVNLNGLDFSFCLEVQYE